MNELLTLATNAKNAKFSIAKLSSAQKNKALLKMADELERRSDEILSANAKDIEHGKQIGLNDGLIDRLTLNPARISSMADGCRQVASLNDPIGEVLYMKTRPNGLRIGQKRVPMGVIGIIFEARPNVTVDAAALCFKAGSSCVLRSGKEAINSSICLATIMRDALIACEITPDAINLVTDTTRESANQMMKLTGYLDVLIPRGGAGLIRAVVENSTVPVIETGVGNCHIYVDDSADLDMANDIAVNAKCSRPSVCNAAESLLVHKSIADKFLPMVQKSLSKYNVILHGCPKTCEILGDCIIPATTGDYAKEYLDFEMSICVVDSIDDAISHIATYSTGHSEAIVTKSYENSQKFTDEVDSAAVYVNASTRFTDGSEFGFGAEIGISTQKLHARGPMGLNELTSSKYIILGDGQIR